MGEKERNQSCTFIRAKSKCMLQFEIFTTGCVVFAIKNALPLKCNILKQKFIYRMPVYCSF